MSRFGPRNGIDSKDYILYMQGPKGVTDKPQSLLGHSLTSPNSNLTDAVTFTDVEIIAGQVRTVSRVKRAGYETSRTYTVGFPSALWTPAMERTSKMGCTTTFFLMYTCSEDPIYNHWHILPEGTLSPAVEAEDIITTTDETNVLTFTSELQVPKKLTGYALGFEILYDVGGSAAARSVAFRTASCELCSEAGALSLVTVGGDGVAVPGVWVTKDRYATLTTPTLTGGSAGDVAQAVWTEGDTIVVSTYTGASLSAATAGNLYVSVDGGVSFTKLTTPTHVIANIFTAGNLVFAVGKNSTGQAVIWSSDNNGQSFTQVSSTVLPAATTLMGGSYDSQTGRIYFVGGVKLLVGKIVGATLTLSDISANLPATVTTLNSVLVIGRNELLVGGDSGYLAQTRDGGTTWQKLSVGAGHVVALAGNQYRLIVAAGNVLYQRNATTNYDLRPITLQNGQTVTGNYTDLAMAPDDDFNRFVAVTSAGEIVFGKPFYPNA